METIRELHFLNANRFESGIFSCVLDCFLELWLRKINDFLGENRESYIIKLLSYLSDKYKTLRSEFQSINYNTSRENSRARRADINYFYTLHVLRNDIWTFVISRCRSFLQRDCNAVFSELF